MSTEDTDEETGGRVRPLADVLQDVDRGRAHATASEALHELVAAVRETGKGGSLTVTIAVKPAAKNSDGTVLVSAVSKLKAPQTEPAASVFFIAADDNLTRDDPHQPQLPLRAAHTERPLRSAQQ